jgi:hypothetical protein
MAALQSRLGHDSAFGEFDGNCALSAIMADGQLSVIDHPYAVSYAHSFGLCLADFNDQGPSIIVVSFFFSVATDAHLMAEL